jgi:hypothetical protein
LQIQSCSGLSSEASKLLSLLRSTTRSNSGLGRSCSWLLRDDQKTGNG